VKGALAFGTPVDVATEVAHNVYEWVSSRILRDYWPSPVVEIEAFDASGRPFLYRVARRYVCDGPSG
jgi:hypothetical protein